MEIDPTNYYEDPKEKKETPQLSEEQAREGQRLTRSLPSHPSPEYLFVVRDRQLQHLYLRALDENRVSELLQIIRENYSFFKPSLPPTSSQNDQSIETPKPNPYDIPTQKTESLKSNANTSATDDKNTMKDHPMDKIADQINDEMLDAGYRLEGMPEGMIEKMRDIRSEIQDLSDKLEHLIENYREQDPKLIHRLDQVLESMRIYKRPVPKAFLDAFK